MVASRDLRGKLVRIEIAATDIGPPSFLRPQRCPGLQQSATVDDETRARDEVGSGKIEHCGRDVFG
jgi:hypothetical protein